MGRAVAGLEGYLDAVLSVESTGIFKPDSTVYDLVGKAFSCSKRGALCFLQWMGCRSSGGIWV